MVAGNQEFVVTLASTKGVGAELVGELQHILGATRVAWLSENEAVDLFCPARSDIAERVRKLLRGEPVDVFVQPSANRRKKLLIADMESTIIQQEMLDELAGLLGIRDRVAEITNRAMNGELDFAMALRERVALLRGKSASLLDEVAKCMTATPGAATLIATMKANGAKCWLASGGFGCFAQIVARRLGFDAFFANALVVREGCMTGDVAEPIFDKNGKKDLLDKACTDLGLAVAEIATIGDGANDVAMVSACHERGGLGVAFHAKAKVQSLIQSQINHNDLSGLLFAQGYPRSAFCALAE